MSALTYLTLTQFKNRIRGVFRSPAKLIYAIIVIALLAFVVLAGNMEDAEGVGTPDAQLGAIIVAYFAIMFLMTANSGFSTGMSIFKMADVNFLFVGPFRSVRVLFHGMFNQMAAALIMAAVILFQYGWMHGQYGVGGLDMVFVIAGYALTVFTAQITAMVIYAFSSGRPGVRKALRAVYVVVTAAWVAYIGYRALGSPKRAERHMLRRGRPDRPPLPRRGLARRRLLRGRARQLLHCAHTARGLGGVHRRADNPDGPRRPGLL